MMAFAASRMSSRALPVFVGGAEFWSGSRAPPPLQSCFYCLLLVVACSHGEAVPYGERRVCVDLAALYVLGAQFEEGVVIGVFTDLLLWVAGDFLEPSDGGFVSGEADDG